ncbi:MAG: hypothetical protein HC819_14945 [Cyclobacteriaceae bacterium]|nr:hypothetical protein [Cyclobacteriaceae bacterium]
MATKHQIIAIYAALGKAGLRDEKDSIVGKFSGGRTHSVRNMSVVEAAELISALKEVDPVYHKENKMRRRIISMAHEMGWHIPGSKQISLARIDAWCKQYSYKRKRLNSYTYAELPRLVAQFEIVYTKFIKGL